MFGCYRRTDAADASTYTGAIALVLSHYSEAVVDAVTGPFGGLPSRKKENGYSGLPDVADVKEACEDESNRRVRLAEYSRLPRTNYPRLAAPRENRPGIWANVLLHAGHPQHAKMMERTRTADPREWKIDERGLHVSLAWLDGSTMPAAKPFKAYSDDDLRRMYPEAAE